MITKVNLAQKFNKFSEPWKPKIVGELNDAYVKIARLNGEFVWHHHETEDEMFLVLAGNLRMKLRDQEIQLGPGELIIIPRGVEHLPVADDEVQVMLLELKSTRNTGSIESEYTTTAEWI